MCRPPGQEGQSFPLVLSRVALALQIQTQGTGRFLTIMSRRKRMMTCDKKELDHNHLNMKVGKVNEKKLVTR